MVGLFPGDVLLAPPCARALGMVGGLSQDIPLAPSPISGSVEVCGTV